jgi:xanthine/uracil permease
MAKEKQLQLGIDLMAIGIGILFFGLYEWSAASGFSVTGFDLLPFLTPAVIGAVLFAVGIALLSIYLNAQQKDYMVL